MTPDGLEDNFYFGGGATTSHFTAVALILLVLGVLLVVLLPRKRILVPFFMIGLLIPGSQVLVMPGMHLAVFRILLLAIWIRIVVRKWVLRTDAYTIRLNALDKVFVAWALVSAVMYSLLWFDIGAVINRLGFLSVALGVYFMLRYLIRGREDVVFTIRALVLALIPLAIAMVYEHITGENLVALFLGAGHQFAEIRNERIRAQGPFAHSIIAGTVGGVLLPLFVGLWAEGKGNRLRAATGIVSSGLMVLASSSSTPLMTAVSAVVGFCFWPLRKRMRPLRWGFLMSLGVLQLVMKAPVWFLINRVSGFIGGTGWHRAELVDQFIWRFPEWALIGTRNNATWGLDMWDAINAFVRAGVEGGLLTFILFVSVVVIGYKFIGRARAVAEQRDPSQEFFVWSVGVSLFCNTVAFFGIIYFDQSVITWYALLVMISVLADQYLLAPATETSLYQMPVPLGPSPVRAYELRRGKNQSNLPYLKTVRHLGGFSRANDPIPEDVRTGAKH
jgi:hypothetical protein